MSNLLIRGGRIIDPAQDIDSIGDVLIRDGRIAGTGGRRSAPSDVPVIDASGKIVCPGLIDMHVHLREPGQEERETIQSGTASAAAGGFTAVACMPNTDPALDSDAQVEFVLRQAARTAATRVYPIGAITKGRAGKELAELGLMLRAGAVAFSDDGDGIADAGVCLRAMQYVSMFDRLMIQHCEDKSVSGRGCMHAGPVATRLGLPGIPGLAEDLMVQRDLLLARATNVRYHVAHVSTTESVAMVRAAKAQGQRVTTEVCAHHLLLTDEACGGYDANFKMNPPLRSRRDVEACIEGVRDGTIDCLITDHAPHTHQDKERGFQEAPFGVVGLESALALFIKALIEPGVLSWPGLVTAMAMRPAQLLGVSGGHLAVDGVGDVTIIDPQVEWTFDAEAMRSKARNTPFHGWHLRGRATHTIVGGVVRFALG